MGINAFENNKIFRDRQIESIASKMKFGYTFFELTSSNNDKELKFLI